MARAIKMISATERFHQGVHTSRDQTSDSKLTQSSRLRRRDDGDDSSCTSKTYSSDFDTSVTKKRVSFGETVAVTRHEYKEKQSASAKWYCEPDLEMLYNHEVTINWRGLGTKSKNMHRCWRGLEHVQGKYDKGALTSNYVRNLLALQDNFRAKAKAAKSKGLKPKVSLARELKSASRSETKEDRKRAFYLGLQDASNVREDLSDVYLQVEKESIQSKSSRLSSRLSFSLSPRRGHEAVSERKPTRSSFFRRGLSYESATTSVSLPTLSSLAI